MIYNRYHYWGKSELKVGSATGQGLAMTVNIIHVHESISYLMRESRVQTRFSVQAKSDMRKRI